MSEDVGTAGTDAGTGVRAGAGVSAMAGVDVELAGVGASGGAKVDARAGTGTRAGTGVVTRVGALVEGIEAVAVFPARPGIEIISSQFGVAMFVFVRSMGGVDDPAMRFCLSSGPVSFSFTEYASLFKTLVDDSPKHLLAKVVNNSIAFMKPALSASSHVLGLRSFVFPAWALVHHQ